MHFGPKNFIVNQINLFIQIFVIKEVFVLEFIVQILVFESIDQKLVITGLVDQKRVITGLVDRKRVGSIVQTEEFVKNLFIITEVSVQKY